MYYNPDKHDFFTNQDAVECDSRDLEVASEIYTEKEYLGTVELIDIPECE